jgi:GTPase
MDDVFPEMEGKKDLTVEAKAKELAEFSKKVVALVPMAGHEDWFRLKIEEKK